MTSNSYDNGSQELIRAIRKGIVEALKPPTKLSLSQWANTYAHLSAETSADAGKFKAFGYQTGMLDAVTDPSVKQISIIKSARVGFALALDTPIPTISGWTTMGEIQTGDRVFDEHGEPCNVTFTSEVFKNHDCYEIEFCDRSTITADADHRWLVESIVSFETLQGKRGVGRTGRPKPGQVATMSGVVSTEELFVMQRTSRGRTALAIQNAGALDLPSVELPIPPYTLGLWLGDGNYASALITQCVSDTETSIYIENEGIRVHIEPCARWENNRTYYLDAFPRSIVPKMSSPWTRKLRDNGFCKSTWDKHVPPAYLRASRDQRLAVLRGLMDSDGTIYKSGFAEFNNTNKRLIDGVYELICSLGMKATITDRAPQREGYLPQYRVIFKPQRDRNPFALSRKADRVLDPKKPSITNRRRIVRVSKVASVPTRCISVDSQSSLFLCSKSMIPTHNTKLLDHVVGYYIHQDPSPLLIVQPTVADAEDYSRTEIAPMLRDTPVLAEIVGDLKSKDSNQRVAKRMFSNGASVAFIGANAASGFRRITARIVAFDEVDGYPVGGADDEGDQIALGIKRTETFWNRKIILGSTPTLKGTSRIEKSYLESDQRRYHVPCPQCDHMQVLKWSNMHWDKDVDEDGKTIKHHPDTAYFVCTENGCIIQEHDKPRMVDTGQWIAEQPFAGHAGFHIWAAYSLFPNAAWRYLVEEFLRVKSDPALLQTFVNLVLGETWEEQGDSVDPNNLIARVENYDDQTIPDRVKILTAGVDTQDDRLEVEIVGWGPKEEAWIIKTEVILGDPSQQTVWATLDRILRTSYQTDAGRSIRIRATCIDSGGHHAERVHAFVKTRKAQGVYSIKGMGGPKPLWPKRASKGGDKGSSLIHMIGVDTGKDAIYGRLRIKDPGPGFIHFSIDCDDEYFAQLTAEKVVTRFRAGRPYRVWMPIRKRNEALDMLVYAFAALKSCNLKLENLTQPKEPVHDPLPVLTPAVPETLKPIVKEIVAHKPKRERQQSYFGKTDGWLSKRR